MRLNSQTVAADLKWFITESKPRKLRSMREFAEQEIVLSTGPFAGSRFRCSRQPFTGLWFDQVDSGRWNRFVGTGPSQSGKTVACFVTPLCYHLFEVGETVICGLPDLDMASDKWRQDILPIIERSRFKSLLPKKGSGSRGGSVQSIQFRNGATLRFMTGGGGDKSRAAFTSRVVVITETDGMDEPGRNSREADKISQLIARTRAFGSRARIYMECTVSTEAGKTWTEYTNGSKSRIVLPCPHCKAWVTPERDHLMGWRESNSQLEAKNSSRFACPDCGECWSDEERIEANGKCRLLHEGQSIEDGNVVGDAPPTDTLGFRWSGVNNLFLTSGELGADEWRSSRSADEENAEREMRQFVWCLPVVPTKWEDAQIETHELASKMTDYPRGVVPPDMKFMAAAIDIGKYLNHWVVVAWCPGPVGHVIDYGRIEVPAQELGVEQAAMVALRQFRDMILEGFPMETTDGQKRCPNTTWVDSGYLTSVVYAFCKESGGRFVPAIGRGATQQTRQWYNRPTQTGAIVRHIGEGFHINWLPAEQLYLCEVDSDHWKSWVHARLAAPIGQAASMGFFRAPPTEHLGIARHLTAEVKVEEFIAGKGVVTKWERRRKQNHWLDALYNACAAAHYCGVRLVEAEMPPRPPQKKQERRESSPPTRRAVLLHRRSADVRIMKPRP